jgi:hypothetical protein
MEDETENKNASPPKKKKETNKRKTNITEKYNIPALKVNIIIVHPRGVVFPRGKTTSQG